MFIVNYILSVLGVGTPSPPAVQITRGSASCSGWRRPDPAIRLRLENNTIVRILGYPKPEDIRPTTPVADSDFANSGVPFLYLRGTVPAYVDYIMGSHWRSRLQEDYEAPSGSFFRDWKVIFRENELQTNEREHCLRMLRCGATGARSEPDFGLTDEGLVTGPFPGYQQIFGWPSSGGVWILRNTVDYGPFSHNRTSASESAALDEIEERFSIARRSLKHQQTMEDVCYVIEQAGGQFYPDIKDCFEVVHFGLIE